MPDADVEIEVEYYTDTELLDMGEAVELTKTAEGEWTLAEMPAFDLELEIEYETGLALNEVDDNTATLGEWDGYEADVTLTRTLQTGGWNTFAVPFGLDIPDGWRVKQLASSGYDAGTFTLTFEEALSIEAGKPYLVKVTSAVENPTFEDVIISNTALDTKTETAAVDFVRPSSPAPRAMKATQMPSSSSMAVTLCPILRW